MKTRVFTISILTLTALYLLFGHMPQVVNENNEKFSAEKVAKDIKVISKERHSLLRGENRKEVADYLTSRLKESGISPKVFSYQYFDSKIWKDTLTLTNLFLEINPTNSTANSYIMLVAHYDSAERLSLHSDKGEPSYGAADDGYGIGVILEVLNNSLKQRENWSQGIRILFTDAEEFGMLGMKQAWGQNRELFDKVALLINIEARGVKGPALLFETSNFNSKIIDLYAQSPYPAAYSLSSTVYKILPNYTDFTIVKDSINGINFSVVDNLYYYHTPNDHFRNISLQSIQHYGEQISPMVDRFLTDRQYSHPDCFGSDRDYIYFTIPIIGLVWISNTTYAIINSCFLLVTLLTILLLIRYIRVQKVLKYMGVILLFLITTVAIGTGISYLIGSMTGIKFRLTSMIVSEYDSFIMLSYYMIITVVFSILFYKKCKFPVEFHIGAILFNSILILITTILFPDNFVILISTTLSLLVFLSKIVSAHYPAIQTTLSILSLGLITLTIAPILYILSVGLGVGAMGISAMILVLNLIVTIPIIIHDQKKIG